MKINMGNADRMIRILIAVVIAVLYFTGTITGTPGIVLLIVAGILVVTSFVGFCPAYALFGLRTGEKK